MLFDVVSFANPGTAACRVFPLACKMPRFLPILQYRCLSPHAFTHWVLQAGTFKNEEVEAFNRRYEGRAYVIQHGDTHFMTSDDIVEYLSRLLQPALEAQRRKWNLEGRRAGLQCGDQSMVHAWISPLPQSNLWVTWQSFILHSIVGQSPRTLRQAMGDER